VVLNSQFFSWQLKRPAGYMQTYSCLTDVWEGGLAAYLLHQVALHVRSLQVSFAQEEKCKHN